ncbi:protein of unknown function [Pseudomonas mediterranea]
MGSLDKFLCGIGLDVGQRNGQPGLQEKTVFAMDQINLRIDGCAGRELDLASVAGVTQGTQETG